MSQRNVAGEMGIQDGVHIVPKSQSPEKKLSHYVRGNGTIKQPPAESTRFGH